MNRYGHLAMEHWARTDPARYATIEDPETFFADLGAQAEAQIQELADSLAGRDHPGEEYLAKVGRLNVARLRAEEVVLTDLVWIPGPEEDEAPATDWVTTTMRESHKALFEDEDEDSPKRLTFRPGSQEDLAPSGQRARVTANLAALRVLRAVETDQRPATAGEQRVLARWSSWGAVPEIFDEAPPGVGDGARAAARARRRRRVCGGAPDDDQRAFH